MLFDIVLFHYPCQDGLASGWVVDYYHKLHHKEIELYPIQYQSEINYERLKNKNIIMCDYTPSLEQLEQIEKIATSIVILDHHITAQNNLKEKKYAIFEMDKSGAVLTWDYFFPDFKTPDFLLMIQDRDLWKWKLKDSRILTAGLFALCSCYEMYDFTSLFDIFKDILNNNSNVMAIGEVYNKSNLMKANIVAKTHSKKINKYKDYNVCFVNCDSDISSDVGNILTSNKEWNIDFAILWRHNNPKNIYTISLRANNKVDVSKIAEQFGGGGHKNASGFASSKSPLDIFI